MEVWLWAPTCFGLNSLMFFVVKRLTHRIPEGDSIKRFAAFSHPLWNVALWSKVVSISWSWHHVHKLDFFWHHFLCNLTTVSRSNNRNKKNLFLISLKAPKINLIKISLIKDKYEGRENKSLLTKVGTFPFFFLIWPDWRNILFEKVSTLMLAHWAKYPIISWMYFLHITSQQNTSFWSSRA